MVALSDRETELREDLMAFAPVASRGLRYQRTIYRVLAFTDLLVGDALRLIRGEESELSAAERVAYLRDQIRLLVPEMLPSVRDQLSVRQVRQVAELAQEASKVPQGEQATSIRLGYRFAVISRFYGWTPATIWAITVRQLYRYVHYITEIRAQESLEALMVASYPHLTKPDVRAAIMEEWLRAAGQTESVAERELYRVRWPDVRTFLGANAKVGNA